MESQQQRKAVELVEAGAAASIRDAKELIAPKQSKEAQIRSLRERPFVPTISKAGAAYYAERPAPPPGDDRNPRDVHEANKLLGLLHYVATQSPAINLQAAHRGLSQVELDRAWSAHGRALDWLHKVEAALRGGE